MEHKRIVPVLMCIVALACVILASVLVSVALVDARKLLDRAEVRCAEGADLALEFADAALSLCLTFDLRTLRDRR